MATNIEWARNEDGTKGETWNPTVGCSRVSPGCDGCYAIGVAHRAMRPAHVGLTEMVCDPRRSRVGKDGDWQAFDWTGEVRCLPDRLDTPLHWRKPRRVFVDSMSDLFHPDVPDGFVADVFATMAMTPQHTYQVLTKRPQLMTRWFNYASVEAGINRQGTVQHRVDVRWARGEVPERAMTWPLPNVWLGTSVENQRYADMRIPHLLATPAVVRFLSIEPLLGPVNLCRCDGAAYGAQAHPFIVNAACPLHGDTRVDWVIVGGESGPGARPMHPQWVRSIRDQCVAAVVPFFFKQWGEWGCHVGGLPARYERSDPRSAYVFPDNGEHVPLDTRLFSEHMRHPAVMRRVGKKAAGRELDGRTWDEMPG